MNIVVTETEVEKIVIEHFLKTFQLTPILINAVAANREFTISIDCSFQDEGGE